MEGGPSGVALSLVTRETSPYSKPLPRYRPTGAWTTPSILVARSGRSCSVTRRHPSSPEARRYRPGCCSRWRSHSRS